MYIQAQDLTDIDGDQTEDFDQVDDFSESDSETRANGPPTLHPDLIVTPQDGKPEERYAGLLKQSTVGTHSMSTYVHSFASVGNHALF